MDSLLALPPHEATALFPCPAFVTISDIRSGQAIICGMLSWDASVVVLYCLMSTTAQAETQPSLVDGGVLVGNTLMRGVPGLAGTEDEMTVADYERINQAPVDLIPPHVHIDSPGTRDLVTVGANLIVDVTATDNAAVTSVVVSFGGATVVATPLGGNSYRATFLKVPGPAEKRNVTAIARDTSLNMARDVVTVTVQ